MLSVLALSLTSCGDSREKLLKDQISWIDEMATIFNDVADGKLASADATEKIKELKVQHTKFLERKEKLNEDMSAAEGQAMIEEYSDQISKSMGNYMSAVENVVKSGKMTKELQDAVVKMQFQ